MLRERLTKAALTILASAIYWYQAHDVGLLALSLVTPCKAPSPRCYAAGGWSTSLGMLAAIAGYAVLGLRIWITPPRPIADAAQRPFQRAIGSVFSRWIQPLIPLGVIVFYWWLVVVQALALAMMLGHCWPPGSGDVQSCRHGMQMAVHIWLALATIGFLALLWFLLPRNVLKAFSTRSRRTGT